jgi:ATP-dependent DNA helicase
VYDAVLKGSLRGLLAGARPGDDARQRERERIAREIEEDEKTGRVGIRTRKSRASGTPTIKSVAELGAEHVFKTKSAFLCPFIFGLDCSRRNIRAWSWGQTVRKVNNMHLQNVVMQLRKVCSHPFLFDWPLDSQTQEPVVDEQLVDASGKMMVLERLLESLFERGHKVLVFSQFVTMLNVIEVCDRSSPRCARERFCSWNDGREYDRIGRVSSSIGHYPASTVRRVHWNAARR